MNISSPYHSGMSGNSLVKDKRTLQLYHELCCNILLCMSEQLLLVWLSVWWWDEISAQFFYINFSHLWGQKRWLYMLHQFPVSEQLTLGEWNSRPDICNKFKSTWHHLGNVVEAMKEQNYYLLLLTKFSYDMNVCAFVITNLTHLLQEWWELISLSQLSICYYAWLPY